jgi:hypothetical protein
MKHRSFSILVITNRDKSSFDFRNQFSQTVVKLCEIQMLFREQFSMVLKIKGYIKRVLRLLNLHRLIREYFEREHLYNQLSTLGKLLWSRSEKTSYAICMKRLDPPPCFVLSCRHLVRLTTRILLVWLWRESN